MARPPASTFGVADHDAVHVPPLLEGRITDLLDGKKIVMTGVTGFIGEQMLWKVLTECPGTTTGVIVRPKGSVTAHERVAALLKKKIFTEIVAESGGIEALMAARVEVIEGDLTDVPALPRDIDVLVHCAGDVSFDPPIDQAFMTNVVGAKSLLTRLREACSDEDGTLVKVPHYVHISTAYTAGRRRGAIPEAAHVHDIDYDAETRAASSAKDREELSYEEWATKRLQPYYSALENLLWPDLFVVGGGVSRKHEKFLPLLKIRTPIVPATLENKAGIVGAAALAAD